MTMLTENLASSNNVNTRKEIAFQVYDDQSVNRSRSSGTAISKDDHKEYCNGLRGKASKGSFKFPTRHGIAELIKTLNSGVSVQFGITNRSTKAADIEYIDGCFADYDAMVKVNGKKVIRDDAASINQILALETVKKFGNFYQFSLSGEPNTHIFFSYDRRVSFDEHKKLLTLLTEKLNKEIAEVNSHQGFDSAIQSNSSHLCFAGKTDCQLLDINRTIPVGVWLSDLYDRKEDEPKAKQNLGTWVPTLAADTTTELQTKGDEPLRYLESAIGEGVLNGKWEKWFSKHPKYPGDEWVTGSRANGSVEGWNVFSKSDSSGNSFYANKLDDELPPVWTSISGVEGSNKNGGSVIDYYYHVGRLAGRYTEGGTQAYFRQVVNDICDEYRVERFRWGVGRPQSGDDTESKLERLRAGIMKVGTLRLNMMTLKQELNGEEIDFDTIRSDLSKYYGITSSNENIKDIILGEARGNSYHPVREYLDSLLVRYPHNPPELQEKLASVSTRFLGTDKPIYDVYIRKHLIAGVKRILEPGCPLKTMVVLQGRQDAGKSTFIRTLHSAKWFTDNTSPTDGKDKDTKQSINRYWGHEFAEIDQYFRKSDRSAIKSFLSSNSDDFRASYGRNVKSHPRTAIFWGSTNETAILQDPTGNVRFWGIPIKTKKIDFKAVESERDLLWAAAYHAVLGGADHWLTDEEGEQRDESNKDFDNPDQWEDFILPWVSKFKSLPLATVYHTLGIEKAQINKANQNRITDILKKHGWVYNSKQIKIAGQPFRVWVNPDQSAPLDVNNAIKESGLI